MTNHAAAQQPPGPGQLEVWPEVLKDFEARVAAGESKYGTRLKTFNYPRSSLVDLYQELMDGCMYVKQKLMEEEQSGKWVPQAELNIIADGLLAQEQIISSLQAELIVALGVVLARGEELKEEGHRIVDDAMRNRWEQLTGCKWSEESANADKDLAEEDSASSSS